MIIGGGGGRRLIWLLGEWSVRRQPKMVAIHASKQLAGRTPTTCPHSGVGVLSD